MPAKRLIICSLLTVSLLAASCRERRPYVDSPAELKSPVKEFFAARGEKPGGFRARQVFDDIWLIKVDTDKADGWGLVAQKKQRTGQAVWEINVATAEKLQSLGVEPDF